LPDRRLGTVVADDPIGRQQHRHERPIDLLKLESTIEKPRDEIGALSAGLATEPTQQSRNITGPGFHGVKLPGKGLGRGRSASMEQSLSSLG
jgi:hypothetical protein